MEWAAVRDPEGNYGRSKSELTAAHQVSLRLCPFPDQKGQVTTFYKQFSHLAKTTFWGLELGQNEIS